MKIWADFFETVDGLPEEERGEYMALLHRNFAAAGYPGSWPDLADASPELQTRLANEWTVWALRDVEWIAHSTGGIS